MLRHIPLWRRALLLSACLATAMIIIFTAWRGEQIVLSPWTYGFNMLAFCGVALAQADSENMRLRTTARAKHLWVSTSDRHRSESDPKRRAYYRGATNALGNFLILDGQVRESDCVETVWPDDTTTTPTRGPGCAEQ